MNQTSDAIWHSAYADIKNLPLIGGGFYNNNYYVERDGQPFVIRVPKRTEQFDLRTLNESATLRFLEKSNFPNSPRLIYSSDEPPFLIISYIEGSPINAGCFVENLLKITAELHAFQADNLRIQTTETFKSRYFAFGIGQIVLFKPMLEKFLSGLSKKLVDDTVMFHSTEERRETFIHGDLTRSNFIINKRGCIYLIDYEFASIGDPLFDFAFLLNRTFPANLSVLNRVVEFVGGGAHDLLAYAIFDVARSIHVVAAKYMNDKTSRYDPARGEARISELLIHRTNLTNALANL